MASKSLEISFSTQLPLTVPPFDGTINTLFDECVQRILFFTDEYENSRLVCHSWNAQSFAACKSLTREDLEPFIGLIEQSLDPKTSSVGLGACRQVKEALRSLMPQVTTHAEAIRMILITKGYIVGVFRKLAEEQRVQLEQKVCESIPLRHREFFGLANVTLPNAIEAKDFKKFYLIFHSFIPITDEDFEEGLSCAAERGENRMLRVMLLTKRPSWRLAEDAIATAVTENQPSSVKLLLDHVSLSKDSRGYIVKTIAEDSSDLELLQLLLADGPIWKDDRGRAVVIATSKNKNDFIGPLLKHGPIGNNERRRAKQAALNNNNVELHDLLAFPADKDV